jgi:hypothetical protein
MAWDPFCPPRSPISWSALMGGNGGTRSPAEPEQRAVTPPLNPEAPPPSAQAQPQEEQQEEDQLRQVQRQQEQEQEQQQQMQQQGEEHLNSTRGAYGGPPPQQMPAKRLNSQVFADRNPAPAKKAHGDGFFSPPAAAGGRNAEAAAGSVTRPAQQGANIQHTLESVFTADSQETHRRCTSLEERMRHLSSEINHNNSRLASLATEVIFTKDVPIMHQVPRNFGT